MAKFILKWRYYKPSTRDKAHKENDVKYIATREGVEKCDESWKLVKATREQERAITKLTASFPSFMQSQEYRTDHKYSKENLSAHAHLCKSGRFTERFLCAS